MLRKRRVFGFIFLALTSSVCHASGDYGCGAPRGSIFFLSYENCNSVPFLSPSNDSRLNLELLLADAGRLTGSLNTTQPLDYPMMKDFVSLRVPFDMDSLQLREPASGSDPVSGGANSTTGPSDYAQGEGSRCNSAADGRKAFENAVNAATGLSKEDAAVLIRVRGNLIAGCSAATPPDLNPPQGLRSALARDFAGYIAGANLSMAGILLPRYEASALSRAVPTPG